jgi:hypothetical protein
MFNEIQQFSWIIINELHHYIFVVIKVLEMKNEVCIYYNLFPGVVQSDKIIVTIMFIIHSSHIHAISNFNNNNLIISNNNK